MSLLVAGLSLKNLLIPDLVLFENFLLIIWSDSLSTEPKLCTSALLIFFSKLLQLGRHFTTIIRILDMLLAVFAINGVRSSAAFLKSFRCSSIRRERRYLLFSLFKSLFKNQTLKAVMLVRMKLAMLITSAQNESTVKNEFKSSKITIYNSIRKAFSLN